MNTPAPGAIPNTCTSCKYLSFYGNDSGDPICTHPRATTIGSRKQPIYTAAACFLKSHCRSEFYRDHEGQSDQHWRTSLVNLNEQQQLDYQHSTPKVPA